VSTDDAPAISLLLQIPNRLARLTAATPATLGEVRHIQRDYYWKLLLSRLI
jgi:hypothetical protein